MTVEQNISALAVQLGNDVNADRARLTGIEAKTDFITVTAAINLDDLQSQIQGVSSAFVYQGDWSASSGVFPGGGTARSGHVYNVSNGGTVDGISFAPGDRIYATTDNAATTTYSGNWFKDDNSDQVTSVNGQTGVVTGLAELTLHIGDHDADHLQTYISARDS